MVGIMARTKDLTEGTRIVVTHDYPGAEAHTHEGTVEYLSRDYDGRSWRWMVMYKRDESDRLYGAWLPEVKVK
jgi:hypothetical protein